MTIENTTTPAPAATFAEFLVAKNAENDEMENFHLAFSDHGLEFSATASSFIEGVSVATDSDHDLQWNVEMVAHNMRAAGDYLLMALLEHQKARQGDVA